jgi:voltage-gated potassium channel
MRARSRTVLRHVVTGAALLLVYAAAPVPEGSRVTAGSVLLVLVGTAVLVAVVVAMARKESAARAGRGGGVSIEAVVVVVYAAIAFFSLVYLWVARSPGQFVGLDTRIDALYFTTATLTTVGYGDLAPVGQLARAVVTVQLLFNLLFVAAAARLAGAALARRGTVAGSPPPVGSG